MIGWVLEGNSGLSKKGIAKNGQKLQTRGNEDFPNLNVK